MLNFHSVNLNTAEGLTEGSQVEDIPISQRLGNLTPQTPQKATPRMQVHNSLKKKKSPNRHSAVSPLASSYARVLRK